MSKFKINKKAEPTIEDITAFANAADYHSTLVPTLRDSAPDEKLTVNFSLRLTESESKFLDYVFERSTEKSKQKLLRKIFLAELKRLDEELNNK